MVIKCSDFWGSSKNESLLCAPTAGLMLNARGLWESNCSDLQRRFGFLAHNGFYLLVLPPEKLHGSIKCDLVMSFFEYSIFPTINCFTSLCDIECWSATTTLAESELHQCNFYFALHLWIGDYSHAIAAFMLTDGDHGVNKVEMRLLLKRRRSHCLFLASMTFFVATALMCIFFVLLWGLST